MNTFCIIFDEQNIPKIKKGARDFIETLYYSNKYELYLFTTRNKLLTTKWLIENNLDKYFIDITNIKIPAFLHLDDRAICFNGNFNEAIQQIDNFQVY